ncbi:hypothetical protein NXW37_29520 [Bacteroides thetaiotaomicron]|nr:hypothetical protein [Bacteroides thetaiotaomicron]
MRSYVLRLSIILFIEITFQVLVTHEFQNESPVTVQMFYGMQSMFDKETHTLTANGKYVDWTVQKDVFYLYKERVSVISPFH